MIKKALLCMATLMITVISASCQQKREQPIVQYIVQPEIELGKTTDFYVNFEVKPDSVWIVQDHIDGLELTDGLSEIMTRINESNIRDGEGKIINSYYNFYTYAKPTRLGKINLPVLNVLIKGKQYQTAPYSVNVVEKLNVGADAIKIELRTDKAMYGLKDTVKIYLYEFSKFIQTNRRSFSKQASISGKDNEIRISAEQELDAIVGIDGFEEYIDRHFQVEDFDWDPRGNRKSIENIGGENYLKTPVFTVSLVPKHKGGFKIGPSEFNYSVYKSNTDYFSRMVPENNGRYRVTDLGVIKLRVVSKPITFEVK